MDWGWLSGLFTSFLGLFGPLKKIAHWKIWTQIWDLYKRVKRWEAWYKKHILAQMQRWQKLQHQIFNQFIRPVLKVIDFARRVTGVIGIFDKSLAQRLNLMFFRVEGYLLKPANTLTGRVNGIWGVIQGILTPGGYIDRDTLLNSLWRDFGLIKNLFEDPFGAGGITGSNPTGIEFDAQIQIMTTYLTGQSSPIADGMEAGTKELLTLLGIEGS